MTLPFVMPSLDTFFASPRRVFAHYFYPFPLQINNVPAATDYYNGGYLNPTGEGGIHAAYGGWLRARPLPLPVNPAANYQQLNMQTEVAMAMDRGITGFCFDILSVNDVLPQTATAPASGRLLALLAAAEAVDPRFSIIPMIDSSSLGSALTPAQGAAIIQAIATAPNLYRLFDDRIVVAAFDASLQPLAWWQQMIALLNAEGINVAFWPVLLGAPGTAGDLDPVSYGVGAWGSALPTAAAALTTSVAAAAANGLQYLLPILPQNFRPKTQTFQEAANSAAFRAAWMAAISSNAAAVQVVTWSDFSESGQIQPYTDASLALNIGTGYYDMNAYYATWYATGMPPAITREVLYWFYRKMASTVAHPNQTLNFTCPGETETSNIELVAFLMKPGTLSINGVPTQATAGITSFLQPSKPGNPTFALARNGSNVLAFNGPVEIYGPAGSPAGVLDLTYWSGSQAD
jgi:hypothetical protein